MTATLRRAVHMALAGAVALAVATIPRLAGAGDAERIVAAGGAVTEIIYRLGAEDRLVAVDTTSLYPPETADLPKVGYFRTLSAEGILSMRPDLVLAVDGAGPPAVIEQIRAAGVPVAVLPDRATIAGVTDKIRRVGEIVGREAEARELIADIEAGTADLAADVAAAEARPSVLFLLTIGKGAPLAAGRDTAAAGIISLAGGRNALDGFDGYKPLSTEAAVAARPDYILMMDRTVAEAGGPEAVLGLEHLRLTPAGRAGRLVAMDGMALLGFGPRTPETARALFEALHPDVGGH